MLFKLSYLGIFTNNFKPNEDDFVQRETIFRNSLTTSGLTITQNSRHPRYGKGRHVSDIFQIHLFISKNES